MGKKSNKKLSNRSYSDDDSTTDNEEDHQQIKKSESSEEYLENDDNCTTEIDDNESWSPKEITQLIDLMRKQIPSKDKHSYNHTISKLNWSLINIPNKTTDQCKNQIAELLKKARRVRILGEILTEIEELLVKGVYDHKKRASAYSLFCQDIKNTIGNSSNFFTEASILFKNLPEDKRLLYQQKSEQINLLNNVGAKKKTKVSRKIKPKKIITFYCDEQFRLGNTDKQQTRKDFFKLDDEAKLKWIKFAISTDESYKNALTKEEKIILSLNGKPRRAPSAFNLFVKEYFANYDSANLSSAQTEYQKLTEKEKKHYNKLAEGAKLKYKRDMVAYKLRILDGQIEESIIKNEESDDDDNDRKPPSSLLTPMRKQPTNDRDKAKSHAKKIEESSVSTIIHTKRENISDEDSPKLPLSSPKKRQKQISMSQDESDFNDDSIKQKSLKLNKRKKHSSQSQEDEDELHDKSASQSNKRKNHEKSLKSKKRKKIHSSQDNDSDLNDSQLSQEGTSDDMSMNKTTIKQFGGNESLLSSTKITSASSSSPVKSKTKRKYPEPDKPASSAFEYFTNHRFNGKSKENARNEYDGLSRDKKKELKKEHRKQIADYMQSLDLYLSQLSKEELIAWNQENDTNE